MEEITREISQSSQALSAPVHLLVFGKHDYIVQNAETLLRKEAYSTVGFVEVDKAIEYIRTKPVDGILFSGGVDPHHKQELKDIVNKDFKNIRLMEHFGGPATILDEVRFVFRDSSRV
ncbi:MAG: hypothetical protein IT223_05200 [Crocinitomicaceae bacterium]|nr:hypothetical protein [Crocinitomicaceae bacterium]